jgi:hypothetical protein
MLIPLIDAYGLKNQRTLNRFVLKKNKLESWPVALFIAILLFFDYFCMLSFLYLKKAFLILTILFGLGLGSNLCAQSGGRKREHRNQGRGSSHLFRGKSRGNADRFAKGAGRKGLFARMFRKDRPAWVYHPTSPGKTQNRESHFLFSRYRTKGKTYHSGIQAKQNIDRARSRPHGNASFNKRKYHG